MDRERIKNRLARRQTPRTPSIESLTPPPEQGADVPLPTTESNISYPTLSHDFRAGSIDPELVGTSSRKGKSKASSVSFAAQEQLKDGIYAAVDHLCYIFAAEQEPSKADKSKADLDNADKELGEKARGPGFYNNLRKSVVRVLKRLEKHPNDVDAWREWGLLKEEACTRPGHPVFPPDFIRKRLGMEDPTETQSDSESDGELFYGLGDEDNNASVSSDSEADYEEAGVNEGYESSEADSDFDCTPAGVSRYVEKTYGLPLRGTPIAYKRCGQHHYQLLARYGDEKAPRYRLVPGYSLSWDKSRLPNVKDLRRGHLQDEQGAWKYTQKDVREYIGVAWAQSPEVDSDRPESSLHPRTWDVRAPVAYTGVRWNDGKETWEIRDTMARLIGGDRKLRAADVTIYSIAKHKEHMYHKHEDKAKKASKGAPVRNPSRADRNSSIGAMRSPSLPSLYRDTPVPQRKSKGRSPLLPRYSSPPFRDLGGKSSRDNTVLRELAELKKKFQKEHEKGHRKEGQKGRGKESERGLLAEARKLGRRSRI